MEEATRGGQARYWHEGTLHRTRGSTDRELPSLGVVRPVRSLARAESRNGQQGVSAERGDRGVASRV